MHICAIPFSHSSIHQARKQRLNETELQFLLIKAGTDDLQVATGESAENVWSYTVWYKHLMMKSSTDM